MRVLTSSWNQLFFPSLSDLGPLSVIILAISNYLWLISLINLWENKRRLRSADNEMNPGRKIGCTCPFCPNKIETGAWRGYFCKAHSDLTTVWESEELSGEQKLLPQVTRTPQPDGALSPLPRERPQLQGIVN